VTCFAENVPNTSSSAFTSSTIKNATLHVPETAIDAYTSKTPWKKFGTIVALTAADLERGDANADGVVNVADIVYVVNIIKRGATEAEKTFADLDGDGNVSIKDIDEIVKIIMNQKQDPGDTEQTALVGIWTKQSDNSGVIGIKLTADGKAYYNEWSQGKKPNFDNVKSPANATVTATTLRLTHSQVPDYYEEYSYVLSHDGKSVTFTMVGWNKDNHGLSGTFTMYEE
jgi:hypothetical protein